MFESTILYTDVVKMSGSVQKQAIQNVFYGIVCHLNQIHNIIYILFFEIIFKLLQFNVWGQTMCLVFYLDTVK